MTAESIRTTLEYTSWVGQKRLWDWGGASKGRGCKCRFKIYIVILAASRWKNYLGKGSGKGGRWGVKVVTSKNPDTKRWKKAEGGDYVIKYITISD